MFQHLATENTAMKWKYWELVRNVKMRVSPLTY